MRGRWGGRVEGEEKGDAEGEVDGDGCVCMCMCVCLCVSVCDCVSVWVGVKCYRNGASRSLLRTGHAFGLYLKG